VGALNEAEQRFVAYLEDHGYAWKHEPDYQAELELPQPLTTKPDFLIERGGSRAVGEVRQFETTHIRDRLAKSSGYAALSPQEVYGSLRSGMFEKAKQLRPLAGAGVPLLVVLANPLGADVMLDAHHVQAAMWGNPGYVIPIDTTTGGSAEAHEAYWKLEDYGAFASPVIDAGRIVGWENRHPHVTAVVVVHERLHSADWRDEMFQRHPPADNSFEAATDATLEAIKDINGVIARGEEPDGAYRWVTVYELNGEDAVPLPAGWFDGPRDERYGYTNGGYGRLSPEPSDPAE
jgi:hypothetical protein